MAPDRASQEDRDARQRAAEQANRNILPLPCAATSCASSAMIGIDFQNMVMVAMILVEDLNSPSQVGKAWFVLGS